MTRDRAQGRKPTSIQNLTQHELADLPPYHPLAEDMVEARLDPFRPFLCSIWPWSSRR